MADPRFYGVGAGVEDRLEDRPDICLIDYSNDPDDMSRTYAEACELARQIADALNRCYPRANKKARK